MFYLHNPTLLSLTQIWSCWFHSSSTQLMRSDSRGKQPAHRYQTPLTKPPKLSTSTGSDPAYLAQSEQGIESVHWKLSWHFPPLLLPFSSWVRLPRELLWWLIDFNHITSLQKSRQRMKVLGNTTPWTPTPHTHLNIYSCSNAYYIMLLEGGFVGFFLITCVSYCRQKQLDQTRYQWEKCIPTFNRSQQNKTRLR